MNSLFKDLKVVDLSTVLAGPSVATFFAELGASVIKVENPKTGGDVTRTWKLKNEDANSNISAYFSSVNFNKEYVALDIASDDGYIQLLQLIADADILITNFKYGDDVKFKLSTEQIRAINPSIIYAKLRGFDSIPERVAYDVVLQAETGYMYMNGTPESGPVKMPVAMMDVLAAHQLKEGILCALIQKAKTGKGAIVECSLEKAGLASLVNQGTNFLMGEHVAERMGSLHPNIAPYGDIFYCKDDKAIVLAIGSQKQFAKLCELLGDASLATHPLFANNQLRLTNREAMCEQLKELFKMQQRDYWMAKFIQHHIPAGAIKRMDEVMQNDVVQCMLLEEEINGVATKRVASAAFTLTEL
jgi:crotonobetainyl-CoA:carnitine CoA-transferase CaiB-like acyl-CoA transferase